MNIENQQATLRNIEEFKRIEKFLLEHAKVLYVDLDGCLSLHTEHVRAWAYQQTLNKYSNQVYTYEEAATFSGQPVDITLSEFMMIFERDGNQKWDEIKPGFDDLKAEHHGLYLGKIFEEDQTTNPWVVQAIGIMEQRGLPCIIVSNGTDEGIRKLLTHWNLWDPFKGDMNIGDYSGGKIFAYDSQDMIGADGSRCANRALDNGKLEPDKIKFMEHLMKKLGHEITELAIFEDSFAAFIGFDEVGAFSVYVLNGHNRPNTTGKGFTLDCSSMG